MAQRIGRDLGRFHKIIRGKIKSNLRKYISHSEMIGKKGKDLVSIPIPQITIPGFRYGEKGNGGVGQGDGDLGQPLGPKQGQGSGGAGSGSGEHILEVELTYDELAEILAEELSLPYLEPKEQGQIEEYKNKYTGIRKIGPESLRHNRRTFKRALLREIVQGTYNPNNPKIIPIKDDKLYKAGKPTPLPKTKAAIIHMMDVSGSITDFMKEVIRTEFWWIDLWIKHNYKDPEDVYIIHDDNAKEVDEDTFYHTQESGGTKISTAFEKADEIITKRFPLTEWNIYGLYRGDGDNFSGDNPNSIQKIKELLQKVNLLSYGEVGSGSSESSYSWRVMNSPSSTFYNEVESNFKDEIETGKVRLTKTPDKDKILDSIRATFELRQKIAAATH